MDDSAVITTERPPDLELLGLAYQIAAEESDDPSTQNGAILVNQDGCVLAGAANMFPYGVNKTPERLQKPLKLAFMEHAERNVILWAARRGLGTAGLTMYCPWFACADCARAIVLAGIYEVVGHDFPLHYSRPEWQESINRGNEILDEGGVKHRLVSGEVGVEILFNGTKVMT